MYGKQHKVEMGSASPKVPTNTGTDKPAGGKGPSYDPAAAAAHLKGQADCAPGNDGPHDNSRGSKSVA